jgi:hypothetical protein
VVGFTRECERGTFSITGKKLKDFQFCLPILPAYLPLKLPNGQFPLKIPGPISQTTLEQNKKNKKKSPVVGFTRGWERGTSLNGHKIQRFPILSANPTCVSSLEISTRTISPENTRSYQPGKTETYQKKFVPFRKEKKLNGGVAILLKKIAFG